MKGNIVEIERFKIDRPLPLKEIIKLMSLDTKKEHLTEEEFRYILESYAENRINDKYKFIWHHFRVYKKTTEIYENIDEWEKVTYDKKVLKNGSKGSCFYYYCMVLCGRIEPDWNILNGYYTMPEILNDDERNKIIEVAIKLDYKEVTYRNVIYFLEKIMIFTKKNLNDINETDVYEYRNNNTKPSIAKATFYILKYMGNINTMFNYEQNGKENIVNVFEFKINNENEAIVKEYDLFLQYIENRCDKSTKEHKITATKFFLIWLWNYHKEITCYNMLTFEHFEEYSKWLKETESEKVGKKYSKYQVVSFLSNLKLFVAFLDEKNILSKILIAKMQYFNQLYYKKYISKSFPKPVSMDDRVRIEEAIYKFHYDANPLIVKMIKIMYLLGLRPSELLSLRWDCLRGSEEAPSLHVHKGKKYKERFIPLTAEALSIVKELREYNKDSLPVYFEYDNLSEKRLFCYRGGLITEFTLNEVFKNMLLQNGIVDYKNKAKYRLYILRKIRISTWLESGISEVDVEYLVGHGEVDSHNFYIISKETRIANAQKVYNEYYKEFYENVKQGGTFEFKLDSLEEEANKTYLEKIEDILVQIDGKDINRASMDAVIKSYPELLVPVSCGKCFAMAIMGNDFECERMKFPCLECDELIDVENHIEDFDAYVLSVFESKHHHVKSEFDGLIERDNMLLNRLRKFYMVKFNLGDLEVSRRFEELEKKSKPKVGRPKKTKSN